MSKKYKEAFERDFKWYLSMRHIFSFDGVSKYYNRKGEDLIQYDKRGVDGKEAFYLWDSQGVIKPTRHPNLLHSLLKTKGSCNLHIKMYAQDRALGRLGLEELGSYCESYNAPIWFKQAVEKQKVNYW